MDNGLDDGWNDNTSDRTVDGIDNRLLEWTIEVFKQLVKDLRIDVERVCLEYETLQNKCVCREVRYDASVDKLKDELCKVMFIQQEEECFEVDDITRKTHNEHKLDTKEEMYEEESDNECDSESESEDDRDLLWRIFDG